MAAADAAGEMPEAAGLEAEDMAVVGLEAEGKLDLGALAGLTGEDLEDLTAEARVDLLRAAGISTRPPHN